MGSLSLWHWLILGAIVLIVFGGKGKISDVMGDFAKGIKSFKKGLADDPADDQPKTIQKASDPAMSKNPDNSQV
jgi:sec-independent protein translocase protein TatA